jgi:hypothetical protein
MLVPGQLLLHATPVMRGSQATLDNTAAVAGLASALTSLVKRTVQCIRAAADLQSQPAAAATGEADSADVYFPAAASDIAFDCVPRPACLLIDWFESLETATAGYGNAAGSSSSSSQAAASAALLAVVFARSLAQFADAMEAAGPEVHLKSVLGRPVFRMRWLNDRRAAGDAFATQQLVSSSTEEQLTAQVQWQLWQLAVLQAMQHLWALFKTVGLAPSATAAGEPSAAAAAAAAGSTSAAAAASEPLAGDVSADPQASSTSSSIDSTSNSDSSRGQQVKWGYLLRLHHTGMRSILRCTCSFDVCARMQYSYLTGRQGYN